MRKVELTARWSYTKTNEDRVGLLILIGSKHSFEHLEGGNPGDLGCDFQDEVEANTWHGEQESRSQVDSLGSTSLTSIVTYRFVTWSCFGHTKYTGNLELVDSPKVSK